MTCRISRFQDVGSFNNYITIFYGRIIVLMQPVPIATNVVSSNPVDGGVYSIQYLRNNNTGDADNSSTKVLLFLFL
jgi:hypothetical protein